MYASSEVRRHVLWSGVEVVKSAGTVMVTTNTKCRLNVGFYQGATSWRVTSFRDNTGTCPSRSWYSSP
ncbi:hypothetical protein J6590_038992, partial [Homalodisca vitripennis]